MTHEESGRGTTSPDGKIVKANGFWELVDLVRGSGRRMAGGRHVKTQNGDHVWIGMDTPPQPSADGPQLPPLPTNPHTS